MRAGREPLRTRSRAGHICCGPPVALAEVTPLPLPGLRPAASARSMLAAGRSHSEAGNGIKYGPSTAGFIYGHFVLLDDDLISER